jgi:hypothetical protein
MTTETNSPKQEKKSQKVIYKGASSAPLYGFGLIGAWVYYLVHAETFWVGVLGILKGIVWPAMLVYELMKYLGM